MRQDSPVRSNSRASAHAERPVGSKRQAVGFTLIELLVVVAIIALLVTMLLPNLQRAREGARTVTCRANIRGIATALQMYGQTNRDRPPVIGTLPRPRAQGGLSDKEVYYKRFWSGVLIDQGFMDLDITHCPNPRGFTGFRGLEFEPSHYANDVLKPQPVPPPPSDFYGGPDFVSRTSPGYDYSMAYTLLGKPSDWSNAGTRRGSKTPSLTNAAIPEKCVLAMEWNFGRDVAEQHTTWNHGDAFGCASMGGMTGKPDWGTRGRLVRHMSAKFGGNNVAFGDLHVASIEPRFDSPYFYAFGKNPTGADPRDLYPMIAFYFRYGHVPPDFSASPYSDHLHVVFAWTVAHTD